VLRTLACSAPGSRPRAPAVEPVDRVQKLTQLGLDALERILDAARRLVVDERRGDRIVARHEEGERLSGRLGDGPQGVEIRRRGTALPARDRDRLDADLGREVLLLPA
jgi:hypothetical protein